MLGEHGWDYQIKSGKAQVIFKSDVFLLSWILIWKYEGFIINTIICIYQIPIITYKKEIKPIIWGSRQEGLCCCVKIYLRRFKIDSWRICLLICSFIYSSIHKNKLEYIVCKKLNAESWNPVEE